MVSELKSFFEDQPLCNQGSFQGAFKYIYGIAVRAKRPFSR